MNTTVPQSQSTMRNAFKSSAWKAKKRARHEENVTLRASLHAQKANKSGNERASIQTQIDAIAQRGAPQGKAARR